MSVAFKKILLISPQPWGTIHISKHHYAVALANLGHEVYFLNPPVNKRKKIEVRNVLADKKLSVIDSGFRNSLFLRYKLRPLYDLFVRRWLKKILREIPPPDIVWCFETNIIRDLGIFKGKKIFHVVDPINRRMVPAGKTADLIICVSNRILEQFKEVNVHKRFINHALSDIAIDRAGKLKLPVARSNERLQAGYVGNLTRQVIDVSVITNLIEKFPGIDFHFWGPGDTASILGGESSDLLQKIRSFSNVFLHEPVDSSELIPAISGMDLFLLAYKPVNDLHDCSNSHKLLEYWATGKIVVSTYIDQYNNKESSYLLQMSAENKNDVLPEIFENVVNKIEEWNNVEMMSKRRSFAMGLSYTKNANAILELLEKF